MASSWPQVSLGNHVDLLTGFPFKSAQFTDDLEDLRLVKGVNIGQGDLRWDRTDRWPIAARSEYAKYELEVGDIVLAMDRPWVEAGLKQAAVTQRDLPALLLQRVARLRGTNGLSTGYLRYLISSQAFSNYIQPIVTGVNVPHISPDQIRGFTFHLPPVPVQDRIAAVLTAYDELIENNLRRIEILEEMAQAVYREWFVNFRFPGHEGVAMVDSPLGPIPRSWQIRPFSQLADFVNGYAFKPIHLGGSGLPIVKIKELKGGVTSDTPRNPGTDILSKYHIEQGDLLFSWSADLVVQLWPNGPALLNQHLFKVLPKEPDIDVDFLVHALTRRLPEFRARAQGTTMRHIKRSALTEVQESVPPTDLRKRFTEHVRPLHRLARNLVAQNSNLRTTRDLLLPKLVSGEIDVSELNIDTEWLAA